MRALSSVIVLALGLLASATPAAAQDCTSPDAAPRVVRAAMPDVPVMAQQQGIQGSVEVVVSLDALKPRHRDEDPLLAQHDLE